MKCHFHCNYKSEKFISFKNDITICNQCYHELYPECYKNYLESKTKCKCKFYCKDEFYKCYNCDFFNENRMDDFYHSNCLYIWPKCHKYKFNRKYNNLLII